MRSRLGYWVKDEAVLRLKGSESHIDVVIKNPHIFGTTIEEIRNTYRKFGEKIGLEGKAREVLIKKALSIGWVRVRYYMRGNRWSIQCRDSEEQDNIIKSFIAYLFDVENEKGETVINEDDAVIITDFKGRYEEHVV